ncbi:MAG: plasmid pRiA4b ORF-3 family protein [Acidobacteriota bacterium]
MNKKRSAYQFEVYLEENQPRIWRRFQIRSEETFWGLHCAIQDSMGWSDYHLHEFTLEDREGTELRFGIPDPEGDDLMPCLASWEETLALYLTGPGMSFQYLYDFGDYWVHRVTFEGEHPAVAGKKYPLCLGGEMACPPEDCGGAEGYFDFLEAALIPLHEEHPRTLQWAGGPFDPQQFDPAAVRFTNPRRRLERSMQG